MTNNPTLRFIYVGLLACLFLAVADCSAVAQKYLPSYNYSKAPVLPEPMTFKWRVAEAFPLTATAVMVVPASASEEVRALAAWLKFGMANMYGTDPEILVTDLFPEKNAIIIGTLRDSTALKKILPRVTQKRLGDFPEQGYILDVTPERAVLVGGDVVGLKYGLQTLLQLTIIDRYIMTFVLPCVEIIDSPAVDMRALIIPLGSYRQLSQFLRAREVIDAAEMLHMNTVFLQVNNAVIFDSAPGIARSGAVPKDTVRAIIQYAREAGLEPIPMVSTFSQQEALFCPTDPNLCLDKRTYNPANPKVYEKLLPILDEVIDIFEPRYIHIGHDEIRALAGLPDAQAADLFVSDVRKIHDHLKSRNVQTMMWADMLLNARQFVNQDNCFGLLGNIYTVIDSIPRDVVLVDAHYKQKGPDFPTVDYLMSKGFRVLGCVSGDATLVNNFSKWGAEKDSRFLGMVVPLWDCFRYGGVSGPVQAMSRAAEAFWRGGIPPEDPEGKRRTVRMPSSY